MIKDYYEAPNQDSLITSALNEVTDGLDKYDILSNIDELIIKTHDLIQRKYFSHQNQSAKNAIKRYLNDSIQIEILSRDDLIDEIAKRFEEFSEFNMSLSQARRARAGKTFEKILLNYFNKLEIPFSYQPVVNGTPDFIIPSVTGYRTQPQDTLVITAKRTVRERWRQITTEGARGYRFMLATLDHEISKQTLNEMRENQLTLIIPQPIIDKKKHYKNNPVITNYDKLFKKYIPNCLSLFNLN